MGGLLRDPGAIWHDEAMQRALAVQVGAFIVVLSLSAFYHFVLRTSKEALSAEQDITQDKSGMQDEDVAEIDSLIVYPVKSGRGIELDAADVSRKGFKFDRRWAVVRKDGLKRLNLKDEPRLTWIIPSFRDDVLHLRIAEESNVSLPDIGVPLEPGKSMLETWPLVQNIHFYGDYASGREAQLAQNHNWSWRQSPSDWISELLGYPVHFLQFDPYVSKRDAFPIFKPPHDLELWNKEKREELKSPTNIEFQDIYPFLIATRESLATVNQHLKKDIASQTFKVDKTYWNAQSEIALPIARFRPNIVLKSRTSASGESKVLYPGFSEDSWETIWITSQGQGIESKNSMAIHLVARCERCLLTTVDPKTAQRDPNVPLAILRRERKREAQPGTKVRPGPCFGMYSIPEMTNAGTYMRIRVGDPVRVRWRPFSLDDECALGVREMKERVQARADAITSGI